MNAEEIRPTRRLTTKERSLFNRIRASFDHFTPTDAEYLTQIAEATARYEAAQKEIKKRPMITTPVINRSTGNIVGEKSVPNPAHAVMKSAQTAITSLSRRLLIDSASTVKRLKLRTLQAKALQAPEKQAESKVPAYTERQMSDTVKWLRKITTLQGPQALRNAAGWYLQVAAVDIDDASFLSQLLHIDDDGSQHPAPDAEHILKFHKRMNGSKEE